MDTEDDADHENAEDLEAEDYMEQRPSDAEDHEAHQPLEDAEAADDMDQGLVEAFALDQLLELRQTAAALHGVVGSSGTEQEVLPAPDPARVRRLDDEDCLVCDKRTGRYIGRGRPYEFEEGDY